MRNIIALRVVADACRVSERAETLIAEILEDLENRTKDIPDDQKPTVLAAGATFSGAHSIDGVYVNYPVFEVLSANDVAVGVSEKVGGVLIDREKILEWDPDMIFFDANSIGMIQDDYANDPGFFDSLTAVKNGALYQWPNSTWHSSNVEVPLTSAYYVGAMLYPEQFADIDVDAKIAEVFDMFIGAPDYAEIYKSNNGAGKSTLLKCIDRIHPVTGGLAFSGSVCTTIPAVVPSNIEVNHTSTSP